MKRTKKWIGVVMAGTMMLALAACGSGAEQNVETETETKTESDTKPYKVAILMNGNLGDKSFLDSANAGLTQLKEELGEEVFDFKVEQMGGTAADEEKWEPTLLDYCDSEEYDVIIMGSWQMAEPLSNACAQYPEQKFIFYDEAFDFAGNENPQNVYNIIYKQNEVSYLVGAAAALMTTEPSFEYTDPDDHVISFVGGMDNIIINDFLVGYIQGARDVDPEIEVAIAYVGSYVDSPKCKDLALAQYQNGADVGFTCAGSGSPGMIEAANEAGKYVFGVDSDQASLFPEYAGNIPSSALKNVGNSLYRAIKLDMEGNLGWGTTEALGFEEGGVGLVKDAHYEEMLPESIREKLQELEDSIISGEISVMTSANMTTEELEELKEQVKVK